MMTMSYYSQPNPFPGLTPEPATALDMGVQGSVDIRYDQRLKPLFLKAQTPAVQPVRLNRQINADYLAQYYTNSKLKYLKARDANNTQKTTYISHAEPSMFVPSDVMKSILDKETRRSLKHLPRDRQFHSNTLYAFSAGISMFIITITGPMMNILESRKIEGPNMTDGRLLQGTEAMGRYCSDRPIIGFSVGKREPWALYLTIFSTSDVTTLRVGLNVQHHDFQMLGSIRCQHSSICSLIMNPYESRDVVFATMDGTIWAWESHASYRLRLLQEPYPEEPENPTLTDPQCPPPVLLWGAHPRVIIYGHGDKIHEVDWRSSSTIVRPIWQAKDLPELVVSLAPTPMNRFTFLVATNHYLMLFDSRYPKRSLLRWRHRQPLPSANLLQCCKVKPDNYFVIMAADEVPGRSSAIYAWQVEFPEQDEEGVVAQRAAAASAAAPSSRPKRTHTADKQKDPEKWVDDIVDWLLEENEYQPGGKEGETLPPPPVSLDERPKFSFGPLGPRLASLPQQLPVFDVVAHRFEELKMYFVQPVGLSVVVKEAGDLAILHSSAVGDVFRQFFSVIADPITEAAATPAAPTILTNVEQRSLAVTAENVKDLKKHQFANLEGVFKYMTGHKIHADLDDSKAPRKADAHNLDQKRINTILRLCLSHIRASRLRLRRAVDLNVPPVTLAEITSHVASRQPGTRITAELIDELLMEYIADAEGMLVEDGEADTDGEKLPPEPIYRMDLKPTPEPKDPDDEDVAPKPPMWAHSVVYSLKPFFPPRPAAGPPGEQAAAGTAATQQSEADGIQPMESLLSSQPASMYMSQSQQTLLADMLRKFQERKRQEEMEARAARGELSDEDEDAHSADATPAQEKASKSLLLDRLEDTWKEFATFREEDEDDLAASQIRLDPATPSASMLLSPPAVVAPKPVVAVAASRDTPSLSIVPPVPKRRALASSSSALNESGPSTPAHGPATPSFKHLAAPPGLLQSVVASTPVGPPAVGSKSSHKRSASASTAGIVMSPPSSQVPQDDFFAATQNTQENPFSQTAYEPASPAPWLHRSGGFGFGSLAGFGSPPASQEFSSFGFGSFGSQPVGTPAAAAAAPAPVGFGSPAPFGSPPGASQGGFSVPFGQTFSN